MALELINGTVGLERFLITPPNMHALSVAFQLPLKLKLNLLYTTALYFSASWLLSLYLAAFLTLFFLP